MFIEHIIHGVKKFWVWGRLRSSLAWILHDWILTYHIQMYWFFCLEHLKKCAQWEIVVSDPTWFRNSRSDVFCKKGVIRNSTKFTGKHLCQSLFFNKVAGLRPATLLKKMLWNRCFPVNFVKFPRTTFLTEHL